MQVSYDSDISKGGNDNNGKRFVLVDEELFEDDHNSMDHDYVDANHQTIAVVVAELAIVPYVDPNEPQSLQMIPPLDMIEVSSSTTQSSLANWWEQLDFMSDDEGSTATDTSTANSFAFASLSSKGLHNHTSHYKDKSPMKPSIRLSSTASNSPLAKQPRK